MTRATGTKVRTEKPENKGNKPAKRQIWGGHLSGPPDALMVSFTAGRDVTPLPMADAELLPFDLWTNRAHAIMLQRQGILNHTTLEKILTALKELEQRWLEGGFELDPALEDVHVNVERFVSATQGEEIGGSLHTGRSRNDQVTCDMRLYMRAMLLELGASVSTLTATLLEQAAAHTGTVMPGFTHHQPAMITTWGHWLCSYAQALCRDLERVRFAIDQVNRNPLGAAAAFGSSWPLDRELTAELLGYGRVDLNTLDCIGARWEHEAQTAMVYSGVMNHLAMICQDLILLSHPYWGMISLPDAYVTGSSIMPQKRNPDFAEIVKGKTAWLGGMVAGLLAIPKGGMSGFNRDTQITKYAVMDVVRECQPAPILLNHLFGGLTVNHARMAECLQVGFLEAADFADALARALGLPFRACYEIAAAAVGKSADAGTITEAAAREALTAAGHDPQAASDVLQGLGDPLAILSWRQHSGAPSPEAVRSQIAELRREREVHAAALSGIESHIAEAHRRCLEYQAG